VFRQFDRDRSGTIEPPELANALSTFGYNLSPQIIQLLQRKYNPSTAIHKPNQGYAANYSRPPANPQGITFDRFVRCCVTVRQLSESFKGVDTDRDGWVNISYETFMTLVSSLSVSSPFRETGSDCRRLKTDTFLFRSRNRFYRHLDLPTLNLEPILYIRVYRVASRLICFNFSFKLTSAGHAVLSFFFVLSVDPYIFSQHAYKAMICRSH
jgi:hypothetical protein